MGRAKIILAQLFFGIYANSIKKADYHEFQKQPTVVKSKFTMEECELTKVKSKLTMENLNLPQENLNRPREI